MLPFSSWWEMYFSFSLIAHQRPFVNIQSYFTTAGGKLQSQILRLMEIDLETTIPQGGGKPSALQRAKLDFSVTALPQ